jgi:hypothetical protein
MAAKNSTSSHNRATASHLLFFFAQIKALSQAAVGTLSAGSYVLAFYHCKIYQNSTEYYQYRILIKLRKRFDTVAALCPELHCTLLPSVIAGILMLLVQIH